MKKMRSFLLILVLALFTLTACQNAETPKAIFSKDEFVLSLNETINFYDYLKLENVDASQVELNFVDDSLFNVDLNYSYTAVKSGRTQLQVLHNQNLLGYANVIVKQKFSQPDEIAVDEFGQLTWNKSVAFDQGKVIVAQDYILKINGLEVLVIGNSYCFAEKGSYQVEIKAVGNDNVDASDFTKARRIDYGVMPYAVITDFGVSSAFADQSVHVEWSKTMNAVYNVELGGFRIGEALNENFIDLNFKNFSEGAICELVIETVDLSGALITSKSVFTIQKNYRPTISYDFSDGEGKLKWNRIEGAGSYTLQYINLDDGTQGEMQLSKDKVATAIDGLDGGHYSIFLQANGGEINDQYFVNSGASNFVIGKIDRPSINYQIENKSLKLTIAPDDYAETYLVTYFDHSFVWNVKNLGYELEVDLSSLTPGEYNVSVAALPSVDADGNLLPLMFNGVACNEVLNSDSVNINVFILDEIKNSVHAIVNGSSILTFDEVEFADKYIVSINGQTFTEYSEAEGKISFNLGDLSKISPINQQYKITIVADRLDESAIAVTENKVLTILDNVAKAEEQTNGYFAWQSVTGECEYRYEIYQVDKDFKVGDPLDAEPIVKDTTVDLQIKDELSYGYYCIRVVTLSTNMDRYLNSDFYNFGAAYEEAFYVQKRIASPEVTFGFNEITNKYYIHINKVDFAEKYSIYLNDVLDGNVFDNKGESSYLVYNFSSNFTSPLSSTIKVVASADIEYDQLLHPASEGRIIQIERLPVPSFTVDEKQVLKIEMNEHADGVLIYQGASLMNPDGEQSIDLSGYNGEFSLVVQFVTSQKEENVYYLESQEKLYKFKRTAAPTNIAYNNGLISFGSADNEYVEKYILTLTLVNSINNNYVVTAEFNGLEYNIQNFIQDKLISDERFESAYQQAESIEVQVSAYKQDFCFVGGESVFFLPSANGTTSTGADKLELSQLSAPTISFDGIKTVSWESVGEIGQTYYSIYIDGQLVRDNFAGTSYMIENIDFLSPKSIVVFANNFSYLSSVQSNEIVIKKLQPVSNLNVVIKEGNLQFNINSSELGNVSKVLCNGGEVEFNKSTGYTSIAISDFEVDGMTSVTFRLVAASQQTVLGVTYYYLSSDELTYELINLNTLALSLEVNNGKLCWNKVAEDFVGVQSSPLSYTLTVRKAGEIIEVIEGIDTNEYSLDSDILLGLQTGEYTLQIEAKLKDYILENPNGNAKGYYGTVSSNELSVVKLEAISNVAYEGIEDERILSKAERKVKADVQLSWDNIWQNATGLSFDITINGDIHFEAVKVGKLNDNYSITIANNKYIFTTKESYFQVGENDVVIKVNADASITSNAFTKTIERYNKIESLEISDDGTINITADDNIKKFLVEIIINGKSYSQIISSKSANIMDELLSHVKGNYTIDVVGFNDEVISSIQVASMTGYRLNGISDVEILESGDINITLYDEAEISNDITFVVDDKKGNILSFQPRRKENTTTFVYSMQELIKLFGITDQQNVTFSISVQKTGNINADWLDLNFNFVIENDKDIIYARGKNYADDYLRVTKVGNTTALRFEIAYTVTDAEIPMLAYKVLSATEIAGYWVVNLSGESYFTKERPTTAVASIEECYGVSLNQLFENVVSGNISLRVSRVGFDETNQCFNQYSDKNFNFTKLKAVTGLSLNSDRATWNASSEEQVEYYVYFYTIEDGKEKLNFFEHVTTAYLDLVDILSSNIRYYINVVTVSPSLNKIASVPTTNIEALKYSSPASIQLNDGKLAFNQAAVKNSDLLSTIKNAFNSTSVQNERAMIISNAIFYDLFSFTANNIASMKIMLKFVSTANGRIYTTTVPASSLIPDLSEYRFTTNEGVQITYFRAIKEIIDGSTSTSIHRLNLIKLYNEIKNMDGIANNSILFDKYGDKIPSGEYNITTIQVGINNSGTISSGQADDKITPVFVSEAPNITPDCKEIDSRSHYLITFTPSEIREKDGEEVISKTAESYVLHLTSEQANYYFQITNEGTRDIPDYQILSYKVPIIIDADDRLTYETNYLDEPIKLSYENGRVTLDLTAAFLPAVPDIVRTTYSCTIYAVGNDYSVNSKTDVITLTLLGIDVSTFTLDNGVLSWSAMGDNEKTRITYKRYGYGVQYQDVEFENNQASLVLPESGRYEYIILNILGSVGMSSMTVDSESYMLENVYKIKTPKFTASGNSLKISQSSTIIFITSEAGTTGEVVISTLEYENKFYVSNNNSGDSFYKIEGVGNNYTYWAGLQGRKSGDEGYDYKSSEAGASEFYVTSIGSTIEPDRDQPSFKSSARLAEGETGYGIADFKLQATDASVRYFVISSDKTSIEAKMLPTGDEFVIQNGDIVWSSDEGMEFAGETGDATIVYELKVQYYKEKEEGYDVGKTAIFYTTEPYFDTLNIEMVDPNEFFTFELRKLVAVSGTKNSHDILTIDGKYYKFAEVKYLQKDEDGQLINDSVAVLGSDILAIGTVENASMRIKRLESVVDVGISNGQLVWRANNTQYDCVVIDDNNNQVDGTLIKPALAAEEWKFNPAISYENNPYRLNIIASHPNSQMYIKSYPVAVTRNGTYDIYKLPSVSREDFDIREITGGYEIGLSKFYETKIIANSNSFYQVKMTVKIKIKSEEGGLTEKSLDVYSWNGKTNNNFRLAIGNNYNFEVNEKDRQLVNIPFNYQALSISFQVIDNENITNRPMMLYGEKSEVFDLTPIAWLKDNNGDFVDSITWNESEQRLEWTWSNEAEREPIFKVKLTYSDAMVEEGEVNGALYYQPRRMGIISKVEIVVKKDVFSFYSTEANTYENRIELSLFAGGNGSETNPYKISNAEQFFNITKRNFEGEKFYFEQTSDIDLSVQGLAIQDTFYGVYNGNGFKLSVNVTAAEVQDTELNQTLISGTGTTNVTFGNFGGLFFTLSGTSEISNLNLAISNTATSISQNTLFTGLALYNYGLINNVEILEINSNISIGGTSNISAAQCGLVGVNYGTIKDCVNSAEVNMSATSTYSSRIIYSGFIFTNSASGNSYIGSLTRCFNKGNVNVTARRANSTLWISGLALNNNGGRIAECGNDGTLTAKDSGINGKYTSFVAGGVLRSINGSIVYTYNNSPLASSAKNGNYIAGIAYNLSSGKVGGLVETSGTYIAVNCTNNVVSLNPNYCYVNFSTSGIESVAISPISINCGDGHYLIVSANEDGYIASIN